MDELKQELEMDEHRIPLEELYARLGTNPDTVSYIKFLLDSSPFCGATGSDVIKWCSAQITIFGLPYRKTYTW